MLSTEEDATADDLDSIRDLIREELEGRGIAEPDVRVEGENVIVDLPGVRDQREALDAVDVAGIVQLRPLMSPCIAPVEEPVVTTEAAPPTPRHPRPRRPSPRRPGRRLRRDGNDDGHTVGVASAQPLLTRPRRRRATPATSDSGVDRARPDDDDAAAARTGRPQPGDDVPADSLRPAAAADRRHDHRPADRRRPDVHGRPCPARPVRRVRRRVVRPRFGGRHAHSGRRLDRLRRADRGGSRHVQPTRWGLFDRCRRTARLGRSPSSSTASSSRRRGSPSRRSRGRSRSAVRAPEHSPSPRPGRWPESSTAAPSRCRFRRSRCRRCPRRSARTPCGRRSSPLSSASSWSSPG